MCDEYLNKSILVGNICSEPELLFDERYKYWYYKSILDIPRRNSNESDKIPIILNEKYVKVVPEFNNLYRISGEIQSRNEYKDGKRKLIVYDYAKEIIKINPEELELKNISLSNLFNAIGYIARLDDNRVTPLGKIITDFILAINTPKGRNYYIPAIIWGKRNARIIKEMGVGTKVKINGRFQSRIHNKIYTAYEVSVNNIERV